VIVPIPFKGKEVPVDQVARDVVKELATSGVRAHLDDRDLRPGMKFYHWERRGVPLRLEIGPEEVKKDHVITVRRDTAEKLEVPRNELVTKVKRILDDIDSNLHDQAWKSFEGSITEVSEVGAIKKTLEKKGGIVRVPWCSQEECGTSLKEQTGADVLGQELDGKTAQGICPICSKKAKAYVLMAKPY